MVSSEPINGSANGSYQLISDQINLDEFWFCNLFQKSKTIFEDRAYKYGLDGIFVPYLGVGKIKIIVNNTF